MQCKENWQLFEFSEAPVILASGPQAVTVRAGDDNDDKDDEKIMPEQNDKDGDNEYWCSDRNIPKKCSNFARELQTQSVSVVHTIWKSDFYVFEKQQTIKFTELKIL